MQEDILSQIKKEVEENKVVLFVKGTKEKPMCGFSAATIEIFEKLGKPFKTIDVLENPDLRPLLKQFSNWPTFPQVYIAGNFVGGCDIVTEMASKGELQTLLKKTFGDS